MARVQAIAESGISKVPSQYVQPPSTRPAISKQCRDGGLSCFSDEASVEIPVIDLGLSEVAVRKAMSDACEKWSAFSVVNHGVSIELLDEIRRVGLYFFRDCSMEEKLRYSCDPNSPFASQGYGSKMLVSDTNTVSSSDNLNAGSNNVLDWRDYFDHHTLPISRRNPSRWPHHPLNYRETMSKYSDEMKALALRLMSLISECLEVSSKCIQEAVGEIYQNITISYYPPCPQPELTLGLQSHSDMGAISLLIQDQVPGLQIRKGSQWVTVQPSPHSILVLLSDQIEIITNGKYRSSEHRVLTNREKPRLSVATFHDPDPSRKISPTRELVSDSFPQRYKEIKYGDYVSSWYTKGPEGKRNLDALIINQQLDSSV